MRRSLFAVFTVGLTLLASSALAQTTTSPAAPASATPASSAAPASPEAPALVAPVPSAATPAAPPASTPPSTPTAAQAPRPGSVIELPLRPVPRAEAAPKEAAPAPSTESEPTTGPVTGFSIEGRITQSVSPFTLSANTPFKLSSPPPFLALGYRGSSYGLYVGPVLEHAEWGEQSITVAGLSAHVEADVMQSEDRTNEAYVLAGGSFAMAALSRDSDDLSGRPFIGLLAGMGARHWVTRHLGVGLEIGESFTTSPSGGSSSTSPAPQRTSAFTTFGTIGLTLVL